MNSEAEQWYVYIVECCDKSLYTGIAKNVDKRLEQHNLGTGAKYTAGRRPVKLVYVEQSPNKGAALSREFAIKKLRVDEKRSLASR